jgi:hypothetical protein
MPPLADSRFEREALVNHAKFASDAASVNLTREKLSNLQIPNLQIPSRQTASLQIPCATIGAAFAAEDAGSIMLAGLVAADWQIVLSYQAADIFPQRRNGSRIVWQWLMTSLSLAVLTFFFKDRRPIFWSRGLDLVVLGPNAPGSEAPSKRLSWPVYVPASRGDVGFGNSPLGW